MLHYKYKLEELIQFDFWLATAKIFGKVLLSWQKPCIPYYLSTSCHTGNIVIFNNQLCNNVRCYLYG